VNALGLKSLQASEVDSKPSELNVAGWRLREGRPQDERCTRSGGRDAGPDGSVKGLGRTDGTPSDRSESK
jgi:hypothetical protein